MRVLSQEELTFVSGATGSSCQPKPQPNPCPPSPCPPTHGSRKGNNGFGNGGNDGSPNGKQDMTR
jgi:hypothetical protein